MTDKYSLEYETDEISQICVNGDYVSPDEIVDILNRYHQKILGYEYEIADLINALIDDNNLHAEIYALCRESLNQGNIDFDFMHHTLKTIKHKLDHLHPENYVKNDDVKTTEPLIQYNDSLDKIEARTIEFYAIMLACSDYPIRLDNYGDIDDIMKADDFEDTVKYYREDASEKLQFK